MTASFPPEITPLFALTAQRAQQDAERIGRKHQTLAPQRELAAISRRELAPLVNRLTTSAGTITGATQQPLSPRSAARSTPNDRPQPALNLARPLVRMALAKAHRVQRAVSADNSYEATPQSLNASVRRQPSAQAVAGRVSELMRREVSSARERGASVWDAARRF